jgi:DNA-binding Lrp family transcriptional regulator
MADERSRELTLYVQSTKAVKTFYRPPSSLVGGGFTSGGSEPIAPTTSRSGSSPDEQPGSAEETYFLSDDQARLVAITEECAANRGYKVHLVDVGKAGRVEQFVVEHLRGVDTFPVLIAPSGARLVGPNAFTEEALCELMPTEMRQQRAFTYIKVRGGDFDRIRERILRMPQVKETHFLTGDWDVFVVLEFPGGSMNRRQVLDFVTEEIRKIPDVIDTSTMVPEYSVTKFP